LPSAPFIAWEDNSCTTKLTPFFRTDEVIWFSVGSNMTKLILGSFDFISSARSKELLDV